MAYYKLQTGEIIIAEQAFIDEVYPGAALVPDAEIEGSNPSVPVQESWLISVGAFYDRFGTHKWTILASTDLAVQALIKDVSVRKYIDLQRPDLGAVLDMIIAAGFDIDKDTILSTPCQPGEEP